MRLGWGMVAEYIIVVCAFIEGFVILWGLSQINREIRENVEDLEASIDSKLAQAIAATGLTEPVNPIQAAIAQMLTQRVQQAPNVKQIVENRGENGLFVKKD